MCAADTGRDMTAPEVLCAGRSIGPHTSHAQGDHVNVIELRDTITDSDHTEWQRIARQGPTYRERLVTWTGPSDHTGFEVESHGVVAVYKPDIDLTIAYGMDAPGAPNTPAFNGHGSPIPRCRSTWQTCSGGGRWSIASTSSTWMVAAASCPSAVDIEGCRSPATSTPSRGRSKAATASRSTTGACPTSLRIDTPSRVD